jgi:hypothetical protein
MKGTGVDLTWAPGRLLAAAGVFLVVTGCGKAPTEVDTRFPTPRPVAVVDLAGTWTGSMTFGGRATEGVSVSISQSSDRVIAVWTGRTVGDVRFEGGFLPNGATPYLKGTVTMSLPQCSVSFLSDRGATAAAGTMVTVEGSVDATHIVLSGQTLCRLDVARFDLNLSR